MFVYLSITKNICNLNGKDKLQNITKTMVKGLVEETYSWLFEGSKLDRECFKALGETFDYIIVV